MIDLIGVGGCQGTDDKLLMFWGRLTINICARGAGGTTWHTATQKLSNTPSISLPTPRGMAA